MRLCLVTYSLILSAFTYLSSAQADNERFLGDTPSTVLDNSGVSVVNVSTSLLNNAADSIDGVTSGAQNVSNVTQAALYSDDSSATSVRSVLNLTINQIKDRDDKTSVGEAIVSSVVASIVTEILANTSNIAGTVVTDINEAATSSNYSQAYKAANGGLEALVVALKVVDKAANETYDAMEDINDVLDVPGNAVDSIEEFFDAVDDKAHDVKDSVTETFDDAVEDVKDGVNDAVDSVKDTYDDVKEGVNNAADSIKDTYDKAKDKFKGIFGRD